MLPENWFCNVCTAERVETTSPFSRLLQFQPQTLTVQPDRLRLRREEREIYPNLSSWHHIPADWRLQVLPTVLQLQDKGAQYVVFLMHLANLLSFCGNEMSFSEEKSPFLDKCNGINWPSAWWYVGVIRLSKTESTINWILKGKQHKKDNNMELAIIRCQWLFNYPIQ